MTVLTAAALWLTIAALTALGIGGFIGACHDDRARERRGVAA